MLFGIELLPGIALEHLGFLVAIVGVAIALLGTLERLGVELVSLRIFQSFGNSLGMGWLAVFPALHAVLSLLLVLGVAQGLMQLTDVKLLSLFSGFVVLVTRVAGCCSGWFA